MAELAKDSKDVHNNFDANEESSVDSISASSTDRLRDIAHADTSAARAFDNDNDSKSLKEQGFPDLKIVDNSQNGAISKDQSDFAKAPEHPNRVHDLRDLRFDGDNNIILMGDNHSGDLSKFNQLLDQLAAQEPKPTHVALELLPKGMESLVERYREKKEELDKAIKESDKEKIDKLEHEKKKLQEQIKDELIKAYPNAPEVMGPEQLMKMIDKAHEKGVKILGLESDADGPMNQIVSVLNKDGSPDQQNSFIKFFHNDATMQEKEQAREKLREFLEKKFPGDADRYLKALEQAASEGLSFDKETQYPSKEQIGAGDIFGDMMVPWMIWRDAAFASRLNDSVRDGGRTVAFAGATHFSVWDSKFKDSLGLSKWKSTGELLLGKFRYYE